MKTLIIKEKKMLFGLISRLGGTGVRITLPLPIIELNKNRKEKND